MRLFTSLFCIMFTVCLAQNPDWSVNSSSYQYNGSITATIEGAENGDLIAAFYDGEVRGVQGANFIPFGPYEGNYAFEMMMFSNSASGESYNLKYYSITDDAIYDIAETIDFTANMTLGNLLEPILLTIGASGENDPGWEDNPGAYEFTAGMTALIEGHSDDINDILAAIDANGIMKVSAKDLATNKKVDMRIVASSGRFVEGHCATKLARR
mgnify:CR=1 FL=1